MKYIIKTNLTKSIEELIIEKDRLALDYKELTMLNETLDESEVVSYIKDLMQDIKSHSILRAGKILSFVDLDSELGMMPADARYEFLWVPNNYVVCILMYAYERYEAVRNIEGIQKTIEDVVESLVPLAFKGRSFEQYEFMMEIMKIYAKGHEYIEKYLKNNCKNEAFVNDYFSAKKDILEEYAYHEVPGGWGGKTDLRVEAGIISRMYGVEV